MLNLTHRDCHAEPQPLEPGRFERVRLTLNDCGQRIPAGSRLRLALSTAYWPLIWPAADPATLTLRLGAEQRLSLPVRTPGPQDATVCFDPPLSGPPAPRTRVAEGVSNREVMLDVATGLSTYRTHGEGGLFGEGVLRFDETGTVLSHSLTRDLVIGREDPLTARHRIIQTYEMGREGWDIRIETETEMTCTQAEFRMTGRLEVYENDVEVAVREWDQCVPPRHGVAKSREQACGRLRTAREHRDHAGVQLRQGL